VATALACRFRHARAVSDLAQAAEVRSLLHSGQGPILISARIKREDVSRVLPTRDGNAIKLRFTQALSAGWDVASNDLP